MGLRTALADATVAVERTPDGRRVCVSRRVDAPRATCWDLLTDTNRWPDWGPSVRGVECDSRYIDAGTTGRVRTVGDVWLPFEVTGCRDYRWTWRVARIPATGHRVDAVGDGEQACRPVFEIPPLAGGYAVVCANALQELALLADDTLTGGE
ncbi:SRPBCC family protein [Halorientalis litorea]|jgi:hypothetical protein|uniref:SRPBCC family protein n=1 Tax=Halorientalis litorea TaxID=2931977 RepID=UPI001FF18544|nr:SRPBCC family protein [Halorientalis litorea]